jgi:negative regulator of sigma E activity
VRATSEGTGELRVLHLTYSDGVSTVSVFEQRGRLDADALGGWTARTVDGARVHVQEAAPWRAVWQGGGSVLTVVADAPPSTAEAVVDALPHSGGSGRWWDRLARGARTLAALVPGS